MQLAGGACGGSGGRLRVGGDGGGGGGGADTAATVRNARVATAVVPGQRRWPWRRRRGRGRNPRVAAAVAAVAALMPAGAAAPLWEVERGSAGDWVMIDF